MKNRIYMTYCSKHKVDNISEHPHLFTPAELYTSNRIQTFVQFCKRHGYPWVIFSDKYGLVADADRIEWYSKSPDCVADDEYALLLQDTIRKLRHYDEVIFFYHCGTFHPLYRRLTTDLQQCKHVIFVDRLEEQREES